MAKSRKKLMALSPKLVSYPLPLGMITVDLISLDLKFTNEHKINLKNICKKQPRKRLSKKINTA